MTFQVSDMKGKHFLDLVNNDNNTIEPSYIKEGLWLKYFGHSNSLCTRVSRAITNHALIDEYRLRFSLGKNLAALASNILLKQDVTFYTSAKDLMSTGI